MKEVRITYDTKKINELNFRDHIDFPPQKLKSSRTNLIKMNNFYILLH